MFPGAPLSMRLLLAGLAARLGVLGPRVTRRLNEEKAFIRLRGCLGG
jgi:hypothetical protein